MAKMKKRRLSWKASNSSQVVGYKLYWSVGGGVGYHSSCVRLNNVTEIVLPDDVAAFTPANGAIEFGITAIDELGNESDMATLFAPYQFSVPEAPQGLKMETMKEFVSIQDPETASQVPEAEVSAPEPDEDESPVRKLQFV
ncbi:MAG: hypothetical protein AMJ54_01280 [Deltaproteobacteria bacterium SG8_13]|nr:MAG: hypothetical protein AMJ54_01280 [Deltaproteobacteria bacterium SG8_13]